MGSLNHALLFVLTQQNPVTFFSYSIKNYNAMTSEIQTKDNLTKNFGRNMERVFCYCGEWKVTSARKLFIVIKQCLMCNLWSFLFEEKMFCSRDIYRGFCVFCEICRFQNLWRKYCCIMQVTLMFISFES